MEISHIPNYIVYFSSWSSAVLGWHSATYKWPSNLYSLFLISGFLKVARIILVCIQGIWNQAQVLPRGPWLLVWGHVCLTNGNYSTAQPDSWWLEQQGYMWHCSGLGQIWASRESSWDQESSRKLTSTEPRSSHLQLWFQSSMEITHETRWAQGLCSLQGGALQG